MFAPGTNFLLLGAQRSGTLEAIRADRKTTWSDRHGPQLAYDVQASGIGACMWHDERKSMSNNVKHPTIARIWRGRTRRDRASHGNVGGQNDLGHPGRSATT